MTLTEIAASAKEVDDRIEIIAMTYAEGGDLRMLAMSIHVLVRCIEDLTVHVDEALNGRAP